MQVKNILFKQQLHELNPNALVFVGIHRDELETKYIPALKEQNPDADDFIVYLFNGALMNLSFPSDTHYYDNLQFAAVLKQTHLDKATFIEGFAGGDWNSAYTAKTLAQLRIQQVHSKLNCYLRNMSFDEHVAYAKFYQDGKIYFNPITAEFLVIRTTFTGTRSNTQTHLPPKSDMKHFHLVGKHYFLDYKGAKFITETIAEDLGMLPDPTCFNKPESNLFPDGRDYTLYTLLHMYLTTTWRKAYAKARKEHRSIYMPDVHTLWTTLLKSTSATDFIERLSNQKY